MTDAAKRASERLAGQGDLEAAARVLVARQRDGSLAPARVRIAACFGEPAARRALGGDADWSLESGALRAALAACDLVTIARVALAVGDALGQGHLTRPAHELRGALEAWSAEPGPARLADVHAAHRVWRASTAKGVGRERRAPRGMALEDAVSIVRLHGLPELGRPVKALDADGRPVEQLVTPRSEAAGVAALLVWQVAPAERDGLHARVPWLLD